MARLGKALNSYQAIGPSCRFPGCCAPGSGLAVSTLRRRCACAHSAHSARGLKTAQRI